MTSAFCPASLSFVFKFCPNKNIFKKGSVGVGCCLNKYVKTSVEKNSKTKVFFNKKPINFPTVLSVVRDLAPTPVRVNIKSKLPLGCGFGLSGASSVSLAFALDRLFNLRKSQKELIKIAHKCEILNKTGLGSVTTQKTGGFLVKTTPGIDFKYQKLPFVGKKLYCIVYEKYETPSMLGNKKALQKIARNASSAIEKISKEKNITLGKVIDISLEFCQKSRIINDKRVEETINRIRKRKGHATMAIFGQVVISSIKIESLNYPVYEVEISNNKAN